jgi:hypothetical protein
MVRPMAAADETIHMARPAVRVEDLDGGLVFSSERYVAQELAGANWDSVEYRYSGDRVVLEPYAGWGVYSAACGDAAENARLKILPLYRLIGALWCYEYQACEHPAWPTSRAFEYCQALRALLLRILATEEAARRGSECGWAIDAAEVIG